MSKNNPRCDFHMYQKNPNVEFLFCNYNFWGRNVFSPKSLQIVTVHDQKNCTIWTFVQSVTLQNIKNLSFKQKLKHLFGVPQIGSLGHTINKAIFTIKKGKVHFGFRGTKARMPCFSITTYFYHCIHPRTHDTCPTFD
jgi:hypothetical protein